MHIEILVEDQSGKKLLELLLPRITGVNHTYNIHSYKGIGRIPNGLIGTTNPSQRILLDRLPKLLQGYGKTFNAYPKNYKACVFILCDLDKSCLNEFRNELNHILETCNPKPETYFCIAVEETEAWFLGDLQALKHAYPNLKEPLINNYIPDSICGTWELLADAVLPGGLKELQKGGYQGVGFQKSIWAEKIAPHMDLNNNSSPSFNYFLSKINNLPV